MESLILEQAYYIGELISAVVVIISIFYLAMQVKQNGLSLRIQTAHNLSSQFIQAQAGIAHDKDLASIYHRGIFNYDQLSSLEQLRFNMLITSILRILDELSFQVDEGAIEKSISEGFKTNLADVMRYPGYQSVWNIRRSQYSKMLQHHVDKILPKLLPRNVPLYPELES